MVHRLNHQWLAPIGPGKCFFGRFLLGLGRIKRPQVMSMVEFSPTALNFGYDFVLLVHLFWDTLYVRSFPLLLQTRYIFHLKELFPVVAIGPTTARTARWFDTFLLSQF